MNRWLFRAAIFSKQLLFRKRNLFRIQISIEEFLLQSRHFYKAWHFSEQLLFQQRYFLKRDTFSELLLFRKYYFWEHLGFFQKSNSTSIYSFRKATYSEWILSQKKYFSKHNILWEILFHSFDFFRLLHFLFVSYLLKELYTSCRRTVTFLSKLLFQSL